MFVIAAAVISFSFLLHFWPIDSSSKDTAARTAALELIRRTIIVSLLLTLRNILLARTLSQINFYGSVLNSTFQPMIVVPSGLSKLFFRSATTTNQLNQILV